MSWSLATYGRAPWVDAMRELSGQQPQELTRWWIARQCLTRAGREST
jgi:hypothetical protein